MQNIAFFLEMSQLKLPAVFFFHESGENMDLRINVIRETTSQILMWQLFDNKCSVIFNHSLISKTVQACIVK